MLSMFRRVLGSYRVIAVFGTLYVASQITIAVIVHPLGADFLAAQTTLSQERVREIFARWQAAGLLEVYAAHYRFDMIHPLWYSVLLAAMLAKGFGVCRVPAARNWLLFLPFVAGACDLLENTVHLSFLADRANITEFSVLVGNGAALLKWTLAAGALVVVVGLLLRARALQRAGAPT